MLAMIMAFYGQNISMRARRALLAARVGASVRASYWSAHTEELSIAALWLMSALALIWLHASEWLGDWTPVVADPALIVVVWMCLRSLRRSMLTKPGVSVQRPGESPTGKPVKLSR